MAKSFYQKLKILYLLKILWEETDDSHSLSMEEIIRRLGSFGIEAERKSIYDDFAMLEQFGYEIFKEKSGRTTGYSLGNRDFSVGELKLLVDAVQSSRFLTKKRSEELSGKLEKMLSRYEASLLKRQVRVAGRVKMMNENIFINIDLIYSAIASDRAISFEYLEWDMNRKLVLRKDGNKERISPWALVWDNEFYYLVAYDPGRSGLRHYRVDKMRSIRVLEEAREGLSAFEESEAETYVEQRFSMFSGEKRVVVAECGHANLGPFIDRFGEDISIRKEGDRYRLRFHVAVTDVFFGWIAGLGEDVRLIEPREVREDMAMYAADLLQRHEKKDVRAVVFDLGNVLVDFRYDAYMKEIGFAEETARFFRENIILSKLWQRMDRGVITMGEACELMVSDYPDYEKEIRHFFERIVGIIKPYDDSEGLVKHLREAGYEVYILSNYPDELYEMHCDSFAFLKDVNGAVISAYEKTAKPDEDIYRILLSRYGLNASECVFLDDRTDNIETAENLGIRGIIVNHREEAFRSLFKYLAVCGKYGEPASLGEGNGSGI
ncbi:MAG: HAD-IA family hydrolase [Lachnospiraceae bacterium]|nr:HAD-IA family hydrolase [Lachnospiraceae bacterium]